MSGDQGSSHDHREPGSGTHADPYAGLYHDDRPLLVRALRIIVPWIVLIAVIAVALTLWTDFKFQSGRGTSSADSTATAGPTGTAGPDGAETSEPTAESHVRIKADGLNMRASASTDSDVIKKLPTGTILAYIESANGWYHVRDDTGAEGWVAAGGSFSELVNP